MGRGPLARERRRLAGLTRSALPVQLGNYAQGQDAEGKRNEVCNRFHDTVLFVQPRSVN